MENKILLFKPQGDMTYIRKLSMSYGYYTALAIVNSNDCVTHVGLDNEFQIVPFNQLNYHDRSLLGNERCKYLSDTDIMSIYRVTLPLKIGRYHLIKECRGMRYALPEEMVGIRDCILRALSRKYNVSMSDAEELEEFKNIGVSDVPVDFTDVSKDYMSFMDMNVYNEDNARGQTKLL